jgi:hypothetical protein
LGRFFVRVERALRWDGAVLTYVDTYVHTYVHTGVTAADAPPWRTATPQEVADLAAMARRRRTAPPSAGPGRPSGAVAPFYIVVGGASGGADAHLVEPLAAAGATWWQESLASHRGTREDLVRRVRRGPPPID